MIEFLKLLIHHFGQDTKKPLAGISLILSALIAILGGFWDHKFYVALGEWLDPRLGGGHVRWINSIFSSPFLLLVVVIGIILIRAFIESLKESKRETIVAPIHAEGGRGGNAGAVGGGFAMGGPGGHGNRYGRGGDGGNAEAQGAESVAVGGQGGSMDGGSIWHPPAISGYEVAAMASGRTVDPKIRQYGRGGMSPGYLIRYQEVQLIRAAYFAETDKHPESIADNIDAVPVDYINAKLEAQGFNWRARIITGPDYEFYVPQQTIDKRC